MSLTLKAGSVYYDSGFTFDDGTSKEKYFVVLCGPDGSEPCLVIPTTSKISRDYKVGCNEQWKCFHLKDGGFCVAGHTTLKLWPIYALDSGYLIKGSMTGSISHVGHLDAATLAYLQQCMYNIREDIETMYHRRLGIEN